MEIPDLTSGVRLRRGMGLALALLWNLPFLLFIWYPWSVFHLAMVGNCFLWALGIFLVGCIPLCRGILFRQSPDRPPPRWKAASVWMAGLGAANLVAWFFGRA